MFGGDGRSVTRRISKPTFTTQQWNAHVNMHARKVWSQSSILITGIEALRESGMSREDQLGLCRGEAVTLNIAPRLSQRFKVCRLPRIIWRETKQMEGSITRDPEYCHRN